MKVLISFCNQPEGSNNNLLILDLETGEKKYLLETNDSYTGLSQDSDFFYALSQNPETGLVIIDKITEKIICNSSLDNLLDPHSLVVDGKFIYVVSTGNDQVLKYEFDKEKLTVKFLESVWHPADSNGERDTHHVNSIFKKDESIYVSAFGKREVEGKSNTAKHGYIENISNGQRIYNDIYHPHSVFVVDDNFYYCGSAEKIVGKNGESLLKFDNGYIRGLAINDQYIAVGISNRRKVSKSTGLLNKDISIDDVNESCNLVIFDKKTSKRIKEFNFFPSHQEIYDIIIPNYDHGKLTKIQEERLKRKFGFDQYGRYAIIRDIINNNRNGNEVFKIMDVGGRDNIMKQFLPNDEVYYLDPFVESDDYNFIKGDGCAMPMKDEDFDWVVSADVFEHIPIDSRDVFLNENIRVAKLGVVLVAPFYSPETARAEINANENYKILSGGEDHIWLREHIENGLPNTIEFEEMLADKGVDFQKLQNNRLFLWQILINTSFLAAESMHDEAIRKEFESFNYFYNTEVFPYDNQGLCYRNIYFIKKKADLKNVNIINKSIDGELFLRVLSDSSKIVNKIKKSIEDISKYDDNLLKNVKQDIQQKEQEIRQKEQDIELMRSSKFWKLRGYYLALKNKIKSG